MPSLVGKTGNNGGKIISARPTAGACDVNQNEPADVEVLVISAGMD